MCFGCCIEWLVWCVCGGCFGVEEVYVCGGF